MRLSRDEREVLEEVLSELEEALVAEVDGKTSRKLGQHLGERGKLGKKGLLSGDDVEISGGKVLIKDKDFVDRARAILGV